MLVHPTIERLHALGLSAMADAFVVSAVAATPAQM